MRGEGEWEGESVFCSLYSSHIFLCLYSISQIMTSPFDLIKNPVSLRIGTSNQKHNLTIYISILNPLSEGSKILKINIAKNSALRKYYFVVTNISNIYR